MKAAERAFPHQAVRMLEASFASSVDYPDPFEAIEVDIVFRTADAAFRVPAFWRGGRDWSVRFAPPFPGIFECRIECTDEVNTGLNADLGKVEILPYDGTNLILQRGALRASANGRHFEHRDGTPFYWLGDTWWQGLSSRLDWEGFQELTADRRSKGFTVVQLVAGLVPDEGLSPDAPGFANEGGAVWSDEFEQLNPAYFDLADRRIFHLLEAGIVPAIVGGWKGLLRSTGVAKMKRHWRYIVARYGAYPVFWVVGGEVVDPPRAVTERMPGAARTAIVPGWTDVARYLRAIDPYRHPMTAHEAPPPLDVPLQDPSLVDFDMIQPSHFGWSSIAAEVAQISLRYARTDTRKPIVQSEIGYENLGQMHFADFQRAAFWLAMLNGAAGHTYGAVGVFECNAADSPLHSPLFSLTTWQEDMNLPGAYQLGLAAGLLQSYQWWRFEPHPEWVTPSGTRLGGENAPAESVGSWRWLDQRSNEFVEALEQHFPGPAWAFRGGSFRRPYAAGIPRQVRMIYIPYYGFFVPATPTVLNLEPGVRYQAYFWEPTLGVRIDLGKVTRAQPGRVLYSAEKSERFLLTEAWETLVEGPLTFAIAPGEPLSNLRVRAEACSGQSITLVLRYSDPRNFVAIHYVTESAELYIQERTGGVYGPKLGAQSVKVKNDILSLEAELSGDKAIAQLSCGKTAWTTPIVDLRIKAAGGAGVLAETDTGLAEFTRFELRQSRGARPAPRNKIRLVDARGRPRGTLPEGMAPRNIVLLDAYRPDRFPASGDWVLVLDATGKSD